MSKQLNIRSDEAYAAATRLAQRLGTTTTDAVLRALRRLEQETYRPVRPEEFSAEDANTYAHFRQLALKARGESVPAASAASAAPVVKTAPLPVSRPGPVTKPASMLDAKSSEERIILALAAKK